MLYFIEFLRAIATVLIANSHFKGVYPSDILSFGGGLGLALFYMISGYLLANINEKTSFSSWYVKKVIRLYIPLYLVKLIEMIMGRIKITSFEAFFKGFIFPGSWFGGSMVIMYVVYFLFVKYVYMRYGRKSIGRCGVLLILTFVAFFIMKPNISTFSLETLVTVPQFSIETPYLITQFIWMFCMLLGFYLRRYGKVRIIKREMLIYLGTSFICLFIFMCTKLVTKHYGYSNVQFLLAVSYVGFAYSLFVFFEFISPVDA